MSKKASLVDVHLLTDFPAFKKLAADIPGNVRIKFANVLNVMADDARDEARLEFGSNYHERTQYMRRGIVAIHANKDKLEASVGTINTLMGLHLFGGKKTGDVAMEAVRGDDGSGKVSRTTTIENLNKVIGKKTRRSKKYFKARIKGKDYIMEKRGTPKERQRIRKGKIKTSPVLPRDGLVPVWQLRGNKKMKIKADWKLAEVVRARVVAMAPTLITEVLSSEWERAATKGTVSGMNPFK